MPNINFYKYITEIKYITIVGFNLEIPYFKTYLGNCFKILVMLILDIKKSHVEYYSILNNY